MTMTPGAMKARALTLADRGWHVFPLTPGSKRPIPGSHGQDDATTDPAVIERMWRDQTFANIGIACEPSGLYVVDVDMNPWKGKAGRETWEALTAEHGHVDTYTVQTWSGGLQFYYQTPAGIRLTNTAGTGGSTGRGLGKDIDTRGNGYVVAAGSRVSEDGHVGFYTVEHDLLAGILPEWIVEAVQARGRSPQPLAGPVEAEQAVLQRLVDLADQLRDAPVGEGNATAARIAYMVGQYVGAGQIDQDAAFSVLLESVAGWTWNAPGDARTMDTTIMRQVMAGASNPRAWEKPVAAPRAAEIVVDAVPVVPDPFKVPPEPEADPVEESERVISMWATDNGQGVFLRDRIKDMLYAVGVGWLVWDGSRWKPVPPEVVQNKVSRFYRQQFERMLQQYMSTMDEKYSALAKTYKTFMGTARLGSILNHLKVTDGVLVDAADLDAHPELLNTPKGVVNLRTGQVLAHDRELLITKITRGSYEPLLRHVDWQTAITALPTDVADYMKLRMGQAVTGYIPESDDAIFLIGHGSNGKSLMTSEGVFHAIGDYGSIAQATLISRQTEGSGATPERFGLRGCRFVLIEELPEGRSLSIAELKRITGMSVITARDLFEKQVTFPASHTLFVTSNFEPAVAEVDEGSWRRLCCVRFPFRFRNRPEADTDRQGDSGLKARIREGKDRQHDAIITWLVEGAMRYFKDRSAIMDDQRPAEVVTATLNWRKESDRILAFVENRLDFTKTDDEVNAVARKDLYEDFCRFLEENGHAKWSQETFLTRFRSHEMIRSHQITEGQIRNHAVISRPPLPPGVMFSSRQAPLPNAVRIFRGLAFRPLD